MSELCVPPCDGARANSGDSEVDGGIHRVHGTPYQAGDDMRGDTGEMPGTSRPACQCYITTPGSHHRWWCTMYQVISSRDGESLEIKQEKDGTVNPHNGRR